MGGHIPRIKLLGIALYFLNTYAATDHQDGRTVPEIS
jgi:hypothetical protein